MSRFPAMLSLGGVVLASLGIGMLLRLMIGPGQTGMIDLSRQRDAEALYEVAGRDLFSIYIFAIACGAAMFFAGLVMLLGRFRFR